MCACVGAPRTGEELVPISGIAPCAELGMQERAWWIGTVAVSRLTANAAVRCIISITYVDVQDKTCRWS
jgi:hypothetical protein